MKCPNSILGPILVYSAFNYWVVLALTNVRPAAEIYDSKHIPVQYSTCLD